MLESSVTDHSPPGVWARSRMQTLQWGCSLVSCHGDICSPWPWLTCHTTKLFLHLNCSTSVSGLSSKIQGRLEGIMQGRRPPQFHVFSSAEGEVGKAREKQVGYASPLIKKKNTPDCFQQLLIQLRAQLQGTQSNAMKGNI